MTTRGADYARKPRDDYPTPPGATRALLDNVKLGPFIFDPCCGRKKQILKVAKEEFACVVDGDDIIFGFDFLKDVADWRSDVVSNPPYGDRRGTLALRFIEQALAMTEHHRARVAMLLPIDFDSGKTRRHVFADCPQFAIKLVLLDRIAWFNGVTGSTNHAWYIWSWRHKGPPTIQYARIENENRPERKRRAA